ncbi:hypothetical protein Tco_0509411 [Tanacetum coccineum]
MENKFRYLGVMVGAGMTRHKAWDDVILKLQSRGLRLILISVRKVSIWSSILKEVQVLKSSGFDFLSYCSKRIGDGQSTSFWKETWIGDIPLCELCPRLFALDSAPNICVAAKMAGPLDTSFRRSVQRRGIGTAKNFSDLSSFLNSVVLQSLMDRWLFSLSSSGEFEVVERYSFL